MDSRISGHTGLLALIGSPVGHSGSPAMYNYSFERLGLDYVYVAFDIKVEEVADAIAAMRTFKMRGCNVTMPCKTEVVRYMDELSPAAQIIGAVNTIVNDNGRLTGHITDGEGFVHNLKDHGIDIKGKKITVAGGGGAATAIQVQCALDGAREISIFTIKDAFFERTRWISSSRNNRGWQSQIFLPHMGRIISATWRQSCCGLFRRAQDMWYPAAEAVYSGMRMRR